MSSPPTPGHGRDRGPTLPRFDARYLGAALILLVGLLGHPLSLDFLWDPFPGDPATSLLRRLPVFGSFLQSLVWGSALAFLAHHWGRRLRGLAGLTIGSTRLSLAADFGLGANLLGALALALGLCGLWDPRLFTLLALLGVAQALASYLMERKRDLLPRELLPPELHRFSPPALLAVWGSLLLLIHLLHAFLPDVNYDSLVYHLAVPEAWRAAHAVTDLPLNMYAHFPLGAECFFAWATLVSDPEAGKVLQAFLTVAVCLAASGWAAERSGAAAGLLAFGLCAGFPVLAFTSWSLHVEPFLALNLLLLLYALSRSLEGPRGAWLAVSGFLTGGLLSVKYTAAPWALCAWAVWAFSRPRVDRRGFLLAAALSALLFFPWLLRNFLLTGSPFYPFLAAGFPAWGLHGFQGDASSSIQQVLSGRFAWLADLFLRRGYGLAVVPALAFLVVTSRRAAPTHPSLRFLGRAAWGLLGVALLSSFNPRLILPVLLVFLTYAATRLCAPLLGRPFGDLNAASLIAGVGFLLALTSLLSISLRHYGSAGLLLGRETREAYLLRMPQTSHLRAGLTWSPLLSPDARVLLVGEARSAYLPFRALANSVFDDPFLARLARQSADEDAMARSLRRVGATHLWIAAEEGARVCAQKPSSWTLSPEAQGRLTRFLRERTRVAAHEGPDLLLRLTDQGAEGVGCAGLPWLPTSPEQGDDTP